MTAAPPFVRGSGRRSNVFDWVVGGRGVDNTGSPVAAIPTFGGSFVVNAGNNGTYQAVVVIPTPASTTPNVGRLRIDEIHGRVCVSGAGAAGKYGVAVGIYVSDVNNTTTLWNVRQCTLGADAARDDYLFLEGKWFQVDAGSTMENQPWICFDLKIPGPVVIGGGQALHVTVANDTASANLIVVGAYFRTRVGPVA